MKPVTIFLRGKAHAKLSALANQKGMDVTELTIAVLEDAIAPTQVTA